MLIAGPPKHRTDRRMYGIDTRNSVMGVCTPVPCLVVRAQNFLATAFQFVLPAA